MSPRGIRNLNCPPYFGGIQWTIAEIAHYHSGQSGKSRLISGSGEIVVVHNLQTTVMREPIPVLHILF